ncbi:hypothetical protein ACODNH_00825 (plasmid) [Haloarcula sp. NS06]|uniref:hypothetical protein n=1 Tax=Haloarcula sp. NS06 TaxID=3409688 RepID=UPI003DA77011
MRRPSKGHVALANSYLRRRVNYGESPPEELIDEHLSTEFTRQESDEGPPQPDTEQLRQLGYLE